MTENTLNILHLFPVTQSEKVNLVSEQRYDKLMIELKNQGITDYKLHQGIYDRKNTKKAIHQGHKNIVQQAKDLGLKYAVICEDDIVFPSIGAYDYFISTMPTDADLYMALIYAGELKGNKVVNGFSGGMSLYIIFEKFYNTFLEQPTDSHIDRGLGSIAYNHEFYVSEPFTCFQRGGYSIQLSKLMYYDVYLEGKKLFGQ